MKGHVSRQVHTAVDDIDRMTNQQIPPEYSENDWLDYGSKENEEQGHQGESQLSYIQQKQSAKSAWGTLSGIYMLKDEPEHRHDGGGRVEMTVIMMLGMMKMMMDQEQGHGVVYCMGWGSV